jgi:hypothetical protein
MRRLDQVGGFLGDPDYWSVDIAEVIVDMIDASMTRGPASPPSMGCSRQSSPPSR